MPHDDNRTVSPDTYTLNLVSIAEEASPYVGARMQEGQNFSLPCSSGRKST